MTQTKTIADAGSTPAGSTIYFYLFLYTLIYCQVYLSLGGNMHNLWPIILLGLIACDSDNKDTGNDTGSEDTALLEDTE